MLKEEKELRFYLLGTKGTCGPYPEMRKHTSKLITALIRAVREDCAKDVREIEEWAEANGHHDECPNCDVMLYPWETCDCREKEEKKPAAIRGKK
jgi:hypothetical protein